MKIYSPEDIVSAYATMQLLEPICGKGHSVQLSVYGDHLSMSVLENEDFEPVAVTGFYSEDLVFTRVCKSYPQKYIDELNAAMAPEQNENQ